MLSAAISGRSSRMWAILSSAGIPTAPVEKFTSTSVRARTSERILPNVSTLQSGPPSGVRAWMCTIAAPASAARFASSAISRGVYGMAGHCSRVASTPVSAAVMTVLIDGPSYRDVAVLPPRPVDLLVPRLLDALDDHAPGLRRVDHVVDHRPTGSEVWIDLGPDGLDHLGARRLRVVGCLDLLVEDDVDRPFWPHDRDLREGPCDDRVGAVPLAAHHVIPGPVSLPHDHRDLRHRSL